LLFWQQLSNLQYALVNLLHGDGILLEVIDLYANQLEGTIPSELATLAKLSKFQLWQPAGSDKTRV
jgi:hypothetical protein